MACFNYQFVILLSLGPDLIDFFFFFSNLSASGLVVYPFLDAPSKCVLYDSESKMKFNTGYICASVGSESIVEREHRGGGPHLTAQRYVTSKD